MPYIFQWPPELELDELEPELELDDEPDELELDDELELELELELEVEVEVELELGGTGPTRISSSLWASNIGLAGSNVFW